MNMQMDVRKDCKDRFYYFLTFDEEDQWQAGSFKSATVFPNPNSDTIAVYIWWNTGRNAWVKRYLVLGNGIIVGANTPSQAKKVDQAVKTVKSLRRFREAHPSHQ